MNNKIPTESKILLEEFVLLANLTEDQEKVLRAKAKGWTIQKMATELNMSTATVSRILKRLSEIYDSVQPFSPILPNKKPAWRKT